MRPATAPEGGVQVLTRHKGRDSSSASLLTPPLSSRAVHSVFSQGLWLPAWTTHNDRSSSLSRASGLCSALSASTCRRVEGLHLWDPGAFNVRHKPRLATFFLAFLRGFR